MDPDACWAAIVAAISNPDGEAIDRDSLEQSLRDLADWIHKGGALPKFYG